MSMMQLSRAEPGTRALRFEIAPWRLMVAAVVTTAVTAVVVALAVTVTGGLGRPWTFVGGVAVATAVNYVYVTIVRKGDSLEAIDVSEASMVALALLLPAGPALLAFALASLVGEVFRDRSLIKRAFNVSIRVVGGATLLLVFQAAGFRASPEGGQLVAVVAGAAAYTIATTLGVGAVIALAERQRFGAGLTRGLGMRSAVWASAVGYGVTAALVVQVHPAMLPGLLAPLAVVWLTTGACRRAERDRDRLQALIAASNEIQVAEDPDQQEAALVRAAERVLLWRNVSVRNTPPRDGEAGERLWVDPGGERWLVAKPRPGGDPWADDDARMLQALTGAATTVLERVRLENELVRQAHVDPLTGVANRRRFEHALEEQLAVNAGTRVAVMLLDLDGFKQVNDTLGHDAGDQLLKVLADRLCDGVRSGDLVARLGGDEFVVMLPGVTSEVAARRAAEGIRQLIEEPVEIGRWRFAPGVSVGVAVAPADGVAPRELLRRADERMYDAKRARRLDGRADVVAIEEGEE